VIIGPCVFGSIVKPRDSTLPAPRKSLATNQTLSVAAVIELGLNFHVELQTCAGANRIANVKFFPGARIRNRSDPPHRGLRQLTVARLIAKLAGTCFRRQRFARMQSAGPPLVRTCPINTT
jgi:hypothetical protein